MTEETMWWPSPEAFDDLTVEEAEEGFTLSAPDDTECAAWLAYWNQSEERHETFNAAFVEMLTEHLKQLGETNGEIKDLLDKQSQDRVEAEKISAGS